ncbi:MAG: hypothetical protein KA004_14385 [Verrucomicrobiales bacterium]|nr:hypothetical protein [Verrucomicrobiales bacterium]
MKNAALFIGFLFSGLSLPAAVVNTTDNSSPSGDGNTSLLEAITNVADGETISFNIPGSGPFYIATPETGYPVISKSSVTIDGYTQPGASPNTAGIREPNNAQVRIVLDSRTATAGARRTVLNYSGFGDSESAVLGFVDAPAATVRGLAFVGVAGSDSSADPYVYNVGLVRNCSGAKIQGCWFGLDPGVASWAPGPDGKVAGVHGARAAVASFRGDGFDSSGLIFGTNGDGTGDRGEFNLCMAQRLAVHLQTPSVRLSGNWINVFPDGSLLNLEKQALALEDGTLEAIENGNPANMLIGTDGNGVSDADEGNIIGPLQYDVVVECWGSGNGIVFAGNSVGTGLDNLPAFTLPGMNLVVLRKNSDLRVGWNLGGAVETNHVHGLGGPFIGWHGSNNTETAAVVSLRGNDLIDNYGGIPHDSSATISDARAFGEALADPSNPAAVVTSTAVQIQGTVPLPAAGVAAPVVDVYLADAFGLYHFPPAPQGRSWLASFTENGPGDLDPLPGAFTFDTSALGLTAAERERITITATYSLTNNRASTTNFSMVGTLTVPPPLSDFTAIPAPGGLQLQWTGGTAPFGVFTATNPAGPWTLLSTTSNQSITTPLNGPRRFYRTRDGLPPR